MKKLTHTLLYVSLVMLAACSSIDCPLNNVVLLKGGFYSANGDTLALALTDTMTVTTQGITENGKEEVLIVNQLSGKHTFSMALSYEGREDEYHFHFWGDDYDVRDTVRVTKENTPHFESPDCSPRFFHNITDVWCTHNIIDSISINYKTVDYGTQNTHLKFYLHPVY